MRASDRLRPAHPRRTNVALAGARPRERPRRTPPPTVRGSRRPCLCLCLRLYPLPAKDLPGAGTSRRESQQDCFRRRPSSQQHRSHQRLLPKRCWFRRQGIRARRCRTPAPRSMTYSGSASQPKHARGRMSVVPLRPTTEAGRSGRARPTYLSRREWRAAVPAGCRSPAGYPVPENHQVRWVPDQPEGRGSRIPHPLYRPDRRRSDQRLPARLPPRAIHLGSAHDCPRGVRQRRGAGCSSLLRRPVPGQRSPRSWIRIRQASHVGFRPTSGCPRRPDDVARRFCGADLVRHPGTRAYLVDSSRLLSRIHSSAFPKLGTCVHG